MMAGNAGLFKFLKPSLRPQRADFMAAALWGVAATSTAVWLIQLSEKIFKNLDDLTKMLRFTAPFPMLAFPIYLWARSPGKKGSHFHPKSDLFVPSEKNDVIVSAACWGGMLAILVGLSFWMGPVQMLQLYGVPYLISVMWLDFVTYLHHHGHEEKLPWYRGKEWSYLRGGLTTLDRDYGIINNIHHDIGTHVIHHLFPQIPHYHLVEATKEAKAVLGKYYREPKKSAGPIPFHLVGSLFQSLGHDHFVGLLSDRSSTQRVQARQFRVMHHSLSLSLSKSPLQIHNSLSLSLSLSRFFAKMKESQTVFLPE